MTSFDRKAQLGLDRYKEIVEGLVVFNCRSSLSIFSIFFCPIRIWYFTSVIRLFLGHTERERERKQGRFACCIYRSWHWIIPNPCQISIPLFYTCFFFVFFFHLIQLRKSSTLGFFFPESYICSIDKTWRESRLWTRYNSEIGIHCQNKVHCNWAWGSIGFLNFLN